MATIPTFDANGPRTLTFSELQENMKESVYNSPDLGPEVSTGLHTLFGMDLNATAVELEQLYRLVDDIWAGIQADAAEGVAQDNVNRLRGVVRNPATNSTAIVTCGGVPTTSIAAGKIVAIPSGGERWIIDSTVVIPGGGSIDVAVTAENTGAISAATGAITEIITAVTGWNTVTNAAKAIEGVPIESDADYRNRSESGTTGSTTEEAIWTRLVELDDVTAAVVVSNRTDTIDADGIPPNTQWIVIYPNTANQQRIAETIWGVAGSTQGIPYRGAVTATVTDNNGFENQIRWDWASAKDLWVSVVGTKDSDYPIDGDDLNRAAITAYFAAVQVGADANPAPIESACVVAVSGLVTLDTLLKIGGAPGPGDTAAIVIAINEYADLNATIGVTVT